MAKKLTSSQQKVNFLAITFQSVNRLISNFQYGKIQRIGGFFAKAVCRNKVVNLGEKWLCWVRMFCTSITFCAKKNRNVPAFQGGSISLKLVSKNKTPTKFNPTIQTSLTYLQTWHSFSSLKMGVGNHFLVGPKIGMQ